MRYLKGHFYTTYLYVHIKEHSFWLQNYYFFLTSTNIYTKKTQKKIYIFLAIAKYMFNNIFLLFSCVLKYKMPTFVIVRKDAKF